MERTAEQTSNYCGRCEHRKHFPKYSCKTCSVRYSSNFRLAKEFDSKYILKQKKKERLEASDSGLKTLYARIKEQYFDKGYLPDVKYVSIQWKERKTHGGTCWKGQKTIKIGKAYAEAFKEGADFQLRKNLVLLMVHESVHLRLAHHRKSFYAKVREVEGRVKEEDILELFKIPEKQEVEK